MGREDLLVAEHAELVKLYIHEGDMSWNSAYFHLVLNLGLISASGVIISIGSPLMPAIISILSFFGAVMNFLGYISLRRTNIYRECYLNRALTIEKKLSEMNLTLDTFETTNIAIRKDKSLKWYDTTRVHVFQRQEILVIGSIWLLVSIVMAIRWFFTFVFPN